MAAHCYATDAIRRGSPYRWATGRETDETLHRYYGNFGIHSAIKGYHEHSFAEDFQDDRSELRAYESPQPRDFR